jgi:hypothetical protein
MLIKIAGDYRPQSIDQCPQVEHVPPAQPLHPEVELPAIALPPL